VSGACAVSGFGLLDYAAIGLFVAAWLLYQLFVEVLPTRERTLSKVMDRRRQQWLETMATRENRMLDAITAQALQNGTAFFASTTVLGIGGCFALLGASEEAVAVFNSLPFGIEMTRGGYEVKVLGLAVILVYAFFKFAWAYRLFNYCSILIGGVPPAESGRDPAVAVERAVRMNIAAGMNFNRGLRAFFALGYLGWFISPVALILSTLAVSGVLLHRQFRSNSLAAAIFEG
jgi:uncharacterized membrane protein